MEKVFLFNCIVMLLGEAIIVVYLDHLLSFMRRWSNDQEEA